MSNPIRRGQAGSPVSGGMQGNNVTPFANTHFILPYGLNLQQTLWGNIISTTTASGGYATHTTTYNHLFVPNQSVTIASTSIAGYSGTFTIYDTPTATTFRIATATTGASTGGTAAPITLPTSIPAGITFVYAIAIGGGGGGTTGTAGSSGCAGAISWGWTLATSSCAVGFSGIGNVNGGLAGYTRYGHIMAVGGQPSTGGGATSFGGYLNQLAANYFGMPVGANGSATSFNGNNGSHGGGGYGQYGAGGTSTAGNGGNGISGGGGGTAGITGVSTAATAGNGGSGFAGGGGGAVTGTTGSRTGGNGGSGNSILTPTVVYTGGTGTTGTGTAGAGGGGAGVAGNGSNASGNNGGNGGLGGGGGGASNASGTSSYGGAGILYLFY